MALRWRHRPLRKERVGNWELKEHRWGQGVWGCLCSLLLYCPEVLEKNPKNSAGALTVHQLSETPPEEACLGLPSPYLLRACPLTQVLGGRSRKSERAGLAPLTGQASPPCLR